MQLRRSAPALAASTALCLATLSYWAHAQTQLTTKASHADAPPVTHAIAVLHPLGDSKVHGTVHFSQEGNGVRVKAEIQGLAPGKHGFHIHEFGDCSAPDGKSAGGHFNPSHAPHAGPDATQRHAGDFGNIEADQSGVARLDRVDHNISFHGANNILGRGMIVHEKADDLKSQPSGDAGGRVACGVIGVTKGE